MDPILLHLEGSKDPPRMATSACNIRTVLACGARNTSRDITNYLFVYYISNMIV